ncbi:M48 family metalloprotease [Micromonospora coxensis]|uniref:Zn-dependent protease with chaperone function n=1 Tax=Micromonospora coxensis TaxID=356852 RepID=A0A1C5GM46_9ACTN|nr:M48 family metalloprotease [Micromonospora coxensis]SCG34803.1 Zn-dependent protease with chaperone function [Micromonospora coxensis]
MGEPPRGTALPPLPSATLGRFVAAVTAVVGTSMFGWRYVLIDPEAVRDRAGCLQELRGLPPAVDVRTGTLDAGSAEAVRRCVDTVLTDVLRQMLVGLAVLAAVTALVYLAAPWVERRLRGLRRLDRVPGAEALRADLANLVREAGLRRAPTFLVSRSARVSGNTFGTPPARYVRLDLGLVHAHRTAPAVFRTVVLHELAHLRNADVDLTRLAIALAWAFPLGVLAPFVVRFADADAGQLAGDAWRLAVFVLVAQVSTWSVLRAREFAADARLTGVDAATARALLGGDRAPAGRRARLAALFRFHPLGRARVQELDRPRRLVTARPVEALGAGLAAGIAAPPLFSLIDHLPLPWGGFSGDAYVVGLLLGAPLALVLTGALWRSAWWAREHGGPAAGGGVFGAALVLGLLVGRRLAWSAGYADDRPTWWVQAVLAALAVAGGALLGRWVALGARVWLRRLPRVDVDRTRLAWAGAAAATTVVTAVFVGSLLVLHIWSIGAEVNMLLVLAAREGHPGEVSVLTLADAVGWHVRILADQAPYLLALPLAAALFPALATPHARRRAVRLGLVTGVVGALALPVVVLGVVVASRDPGLGAATLRGLVDGHTLLPVTLVELTAAVAAVAGSRLSTWHATLAALTAGLVLAPAALAATVLLTCSGGDQGCAALVHRAAVTRALGHALLVAPVFATLAAALGAAVTAALTVVGRPPYRRWAVSGAVVLALLAVAGGVAATYRLPATAPEAGRDPCLVGVWRLTTGRYHAPVAADSVLGTLAGLRRGADLDLTSDSATGYATAYRADGTATDLYDLAVAEGTLNGQRVRRVARGAVSYRWTAEDGRYTQRDGVQAGLVALLRVGRHEVDVTSAPRNSAGSYRCDGQRLVIRLETDDGSWDEEVFVRSPA